MIETECFAELNAIYEENGELVWDLRPDCSSADDRRNGSSKPGFFSRLFKRKVRYFFIYQGIDTLICCFVTVTALECHNEHEKKLKLMKTARKVIF